MEKTKLYCLEKIRNSRGNVVEYVMGDEHGDTGNFDRDGVIGLLKDKKYNVMNLQLDSLNRVVDKAMEKEANIIEKIKQHSKSNDLQSIFDRAYGFILKNGMVMICQRGKSIKLTEPFDMLKGQINIDVLQYDFETYVKAKYGFVPTKLEVVNVGKNFRYIMYGKEYVDSTIMDKEGFFCGVDSISNFKINYNVNEKDYQVYKRVGKLKNVENAFCGIIIHDKRNKMAADWADQQIKKLDKHIDKMTTGSGSSSNSKKGNFIQVLNRFKK